MALLNTGCLISTIQADVTGVTTGYAAECFVVLAAAVDAATTDRCVTVPNSGSLGSLYPTQTIPEGQLVFVDDVGVPVTAASGKWIGLDGRGLRYDFPVSTLWTWGCNATFSAGALGDETTTNRSSPGSVAGAGVTWCSVSMGYSTAALKNDNTLWTWGFNSAGSLGSGNSSQRSSPGTTAGGGTNWCFVSMARTGTHAAGIKTDGTLWTWGNNNCGQLGDGTITNRSSPGTVAGGGTNWCFVSTGQNSTAAIKTDGSLWTWGCNSSGELGNGTTTSRSSPGTVAGGGLTWCLVDVFRKHMIAIKADGTLWTWGYNNFGRLGDGTTTNRSSPGTTAGGGATWCDASVGYYNGVAIKTDGTLWTWGYNFRGILGTTSVTFRSSPGTVAGGGTTWKKAISNLEHVVALKTDGALWAWGQNNVGQLGDGTTTCSSSPISINAGPATWTKIAAGKASSAGIKCSIC